MSFTSLISRGTARQRFVTLCDATIDAYSERTCSYRQYPVLSEVSKNVVFRRNARAGLEEYAADFLVLLPPAAECTEATTLLRGAWSAADDLARPGQRPIEYAIRHAAREPIFAPQYTALYCGGAP